MTTALAMKSSPTAATTTTGSVSSIVDACVVVIRTIVHYYGSLMHYWLLHGKYSDCPYFAYDLHAKTFVYTIALLQPLWDQPHYRNPTFYDDLIKNLRNIAIPGTCFPLSWIASTRLVLVPFLVVVYPWLCVIGTLVEFYLVATNQVVAAADNDDNASNLLLLGNGGFGGLVESLLRQFARLLVTPQHWFSFWRINCHFVSLHSLKNPQAHVSYLMENKWEFLVAGEQHQVPVSPFLKTPHALVIKDRNEEGGMGIFFFKNAVSGGEWIIQEKLENAAFVQSLLPPNAPLSTFRILTSSRLGLVNVAGDSSPSTGRRDGDHAPVQSLTCVFRAGLQDASTDHESIMFDVDLNTGTIRTGSTTTHWYHIGPQYLFNTPLSVGHAITCHPDTGKRLTGQVIKEIHQMKQLVEDAHLRLLPHVPLAGWDVALTTKGIYLLEVNLSCNFFRGSFDQKKYFEFLHEYFTQLDALPFPKHKKTQ